MRHTAHLVLLTALLGNVLHCISGQTLKEVLKYRPFLSKTFFDKLFGSDFAIIAATGPINRLSSLHWNIRLGLRHCLMIYHGTNYKAYVHGTLVCLNGYYHFCMSEDAVTHVQELTSQYAPGCMRFRFSEPIPSQNAMTWDIQVNMVFHINLTVLDLQMTYHPQSRCHNSLVKDGRYNGQGLAIGNHIAVCRRTKHQSYLVPMSEVRVILNFTWLPDDPFLEFMYEVMMPREAMESYLTLFKLDFSQLYFFESFQNTKQRLIVYIRSSVRHTVSLVNVTLLCKNNFGKVKELYFVDGPIFLIGSYLQSDALIARLDFVNAVSSATNSTLKDNNNRYLYIDQVKASIGDLTVVLQSRNEEDMSGVNFRFNSDLPSTPYGLFNLTDYTNAEPGLPSDNILANVSLPIEGRHFHVTYRLQRRSWNFLSNPRLLFQFIKFDMLSFEDGCNTGGIFIVENDTTIASYCSRAGVTFLNSTTKEGGILFGISPLVIILKGYSWLANIQLIISVSYDRCLGVPNICDKFLGNSPIFPDKCTAGKMTCRYVKPEPCLESVQLPSDGLFYNPTACGMVSDVDLSNTFGYVGFTNALNISFKVENHLGLNQDFKDPQKVIPMINTLFQEHSTFLSAFPFRFGREFRLNKNYTLKSKLMFTTIVNTFSWLGMGIWFRLTVDIGCSEQISRQPLPHVDILGGCRQLRLSSVVGHAKIRFHESIFIPKKKISCLGRLNSIIL